MRTGTQNAHSVTHQKTRINRGSKCREECTELTDQGRQLRSLTTSNQNAEGVGTSIHDEKCEEMSAKRRIHIQCNSVKQHGGTKCLEESTVATLRINGPGKA